MIKSTKIKDIPNLFSQTKSDRYYSDICEFLESGFESCEHVLDNGDKSYLASLGLRYVAKKTSSPVYVIERAGRVFLLRKNPAELGGDAP